MNPPDLRDDLVEFLRSSCCLAVKQGVDRVEAYPLSSVSERHDRAVLLGYIEAWKQRHADASVEILPA